MLLVWEYLIFMTAFITVVASH